MDREETAPHRSAGEARTLRILHLEDQPNDALLVEAALKRDELDCQVQVVATREDYLAVLAGGGLDLILSDYSLPGFDGMTALSIARQQAPDVPFLFVSGAMGEDAAVESLRSGATDYVLKQRLTRLGPAVARALNEAAERRARREAEDALRREQHFLRAVLDSLQTGVVACDSTGTVTLFNRAARETHGLPNAPLPAMERARHYKLLSADGKTRMPDEDLPLFRALRGERVRDAVLVIAPSNGPARTVLVSGQPIVDDLGQSLGAVVAQHDVTEHRHLEAQLRQAQKLEAIGLLAGGIAHDFNNLLTAIMGYGQLMQNRQQEEDPAFSDTQEILKAADRAASLTRQLLAFSRQQVLDLRVLDLNAVVTDLHKMMRRLIGENIDLLTVPAANLGRIKADRGQLEQVLINLVVNARDAMPSGGKLTIETANVDLDEGYARSRIELKAGRYVFVAVSDTGCGMSPEVVARIFEPFYTTKEQGKGTGLGLSTVHGIVKQSDGHIEVYSEQGTGTTFKIYLPHVEEAAEATAPPVSSAKPRHGRETILLVEDEEVIRRVITQSLESHGYHVLTAEDGSQAIAFCEGSDQPIDLLITDVVMPLMSGPQLVHRMASLRPELPVLYISGYTDHALVHQGHREAGSAFLQKPFTPDVLARKVREVLDLGFRQAA